MGGLRQLIFLVSGIKGIEQLSFFLTACIEREPGFFALKGICLFKPQKDIIWQVCQDDKKALKLNPHGQGDRNYVMLVDTSYRYMAAFLVPLRYYNFK